MTGSWDDVPGVFARAAALGFSHVLMPPPWPGDAADPFLSLDFDGPTQAPGGLDALIEAARAAGIGLLLDVVLDRVADSGVLARESGSPFSRPDEASRLDPRRHALAGAALARMDGPDDLAVLAGWWGRRLSTWHAAGVAGFRLLGLRALPENLLASFVASLRDAVPGALLLAWTPGLSRDAALSLRGRGLDGVFASLPWWDGRAGWFWDELKDLLEVAPVLGCDGVPPGPGTHGAIRQPAALAAYIGQGWLHVAEGAGDAAELRAVNAMLRDEPAFAARLAPATPLGDGGKVVGLFRADAAELRTARRAAIVVINTDRVLTHQVDGASLLTQAGGAFASFHDASGVCLSPGVAVRLEPGRSAVFTALPRKVGGPHAGVSGEAARRAAATGRLAIELPEPCVDDGRFPVKAVVGEALHVRADILFDGHEKIAAAVRWRAPGETSWAEAAMRPLGNDRWEGVLPLTVIGRYEYVVTAWRDRFETFRDELTKKAKAGVNVKLELEEGYAMVQQASARLGSPQRLTTLLKGLRGADETARVAAFLAPELATLMAAADDRPFRVQTTEIAVDAERALARFASWYEVFPRSLSDDPSRHGTFADVERHLPRIAGMGFDVLYFPPISPIGRKNRKGRNNTLTPAPDDPGSPYAGGSDDGGHDALHPELGTLEDFQHLQAAAAWHGVEIAIDFAIQCSPDHPWLSQHRGWFDWRPDGSIKYAENPPKKYEDIVNVDFYAEDAVPGLWVALCEVVLFWCQQGIRIFRVDNPHTKPFPFWEWMICEVRARYPDAMFLAEAFTRPKIMYRLAKIGFSQSYTYFTWRNEKAELAAYLTELNQPPVSYFFRPHFFVNTPDINPVFLQGSGRPGFLIRAALAATLSGLFGVYNGFELCEAAAVPGREEYLDSEKYQIRAWDWERPGNIIAEIRVLNGLRRRNPALQTHLGVTFLPASDDAILFYEKATFDRSNVVLVAVCLDPHAAHEADIELPLWSWRIPDEGALEMDNLLTGSVGLWHGKHHRLRLSPEQPYAIWRARKPD
jgi:starch synthase (maltosyl-transferring)